MIVTPDLEGIFSTVLPAKATIGVVHGSSHPAVSVLSMLQREFHSTVDLGSVSPHTPKDEIDRAGAIARQTGVEYIVGVGGGSIIDAAKLIALSSAAGNITPYALKFTPPDRMEFNLLAAELIASVPSVIAVPTTAGSASEISAGAGMRVGREKLLFNQPALIPSIAIYCPDLVSQAPPHIWYPSWLSAVARGFESIYSKRRSWLSDAWAFEGLRLLGSAPRNPHTDDRLSLEQARALLAGSMLTGKALGMAGGGVVHAIGHAVGALTGLPHGIAHGACLPIAVAEVIRLVPPLFPVLAHAAGQLSGKAPDSPILLREELNGLRWRSLEPNWDQIFERSAVVEATILEPLIMTHPFPVTRPFVELIISSLV